MTKATRARVKRGEKVTTLTLKQLRFVEEFEKSMDKTDACLKAGYQTKNPGIMGDQVFNHPAVQAELDKRFERRRKRMEVKGDFLVNKLLEIIEDTQKDNPQACLRAIELAGKSIALWKERQEISGPDGKAIEMEQRVQEDVADFKGRIDSIAKRAGTGGVAQFPKPGSAS